MVSRPVKKLGMLENMKRCKTEMLRYPHHLHPWCSVGSTDSEEEKTGSKTGRTFLSHPQRLETPAKSNPGL